MYQIAWALDQTQIKIWEKSRRIGASWVEALVSVLYAIGFFGKPCDTFYISYNREMSEQFIDDCSLWARALNIAAFAFIHNKDGTQDQFIGTELEHFFTRHDQNSVSGLDRITPPRDPKEEGIYLSSNSTNNSIDKGITKGVNRTLEECTSVLLNPGKDILEYRIRFFNGRKIVALSSNPTNARAKKGRLVIDEAGHHPDLEELLKASKAIKMWGGQIVLMSTHNGEDHPFNILCQSIKDGSVDRKRHSLHRTTLQDACKQGLYKRMCQINGESWSLEKEFAWISEQYRDYGSAADEELGCIPLAGAKNLFDVAAVDLYARGHYTGRKAGHHYLLAIDPNHGSWKGDFWDVQVWDITQLPYCLVQTWRSNEDSPEKCFKETSNLIDIFRPVLVGAEANGGGVIVAERIAAAHPKTPVEVISHSNTTKRVNTDRAADMVACGELLYPLEWSGVQEMKRFSKLKREAKFGHDDAVMCLTVFCALIDTARELLPRVIRGAATANDLATPFGRNSGQKLGARPQAVPPPPVTDRPLNPRSPAIPPRLFPPRQ